MSVTTKKAALLSITASVAERLAAPSLEVFDYLAEGEFGDPRDWPLWKREQFAAAAVALMLPEMSPEWATAPDGDPTQVGPSMSEDAARAQADGWNSSPHTVDRAAVMRREVTPWIEATR